MIIQSAHLSDIPSMLDIYGSARNYQIKTKQPTFAIFTKESIEAGIESQQYYKIEIEKKIAGIFTITFEDVLIWDKLENLCSVYLHRIATHPDFKGRNLMRVITDFAVDFAKKNNRQFVRMDTWNGNDNLKNYYLQFGFNIVGTRILPNDERLNKHYWGETCVYLELKI